EVVFLGGNRLFADIPNLARRGNVLVAVLRDPGEAVAHRPNLDVQAEMIGVDPQQISELLLTRLPFTFDVLDHEDAEAVAQGPPRQAQGAGCLALAVAGDHDHQPATPFVAHRSPHTAWRQQSSTGRPSTSSKGR